MTNLSITTHNNLFASKHYVRGPLQAARGTHTLIHLCNKNKKHTQTLDVTEACLQWTAEFSSPVQDGLAAAVQVVELLLGDGVVHVHGGHAQLASLG